MGDEVADVGEVGELADVVEVAEVADTQLRMDANAWADAIKRLSSGEECVLRVKGRQVKVRRDGTTFYSITEDDGHAFYNLDIYTLCERVCELAGLARG